jgi:hypothetical protein
MASGRGRQQVPARLIMPVRPWTTRSAGQPSGKAWSPRLAGWKPSPARRTWQNRWLARRRKSGGLATTGHRLAGAPPVPPGSPPAGQRGGLMLFLCGDTIQPGACLPAGWLAAAMRAHSAHPGRPGNSAADCSWMMSDPLTCVRWNQGRPTAVVPSMLPPALRPRGRVPRFGHADLSVRCNGTLLSLLCKISVTVTLVPLALHR